MDSIGITGNPGTGKKTIASKLSEKINVDLFDINKFIIEKSALLASPTACDVISASI